MGEKRKFIADSMMGKFVKLMRILGFDVEYEKAGPEKLVERARKEKRIIVTRRRRFQFPDDVDVIVLEENYPHDQVEKVLSTYNLTPSPEGFLSRCLVCNVKLREADKEEVKDRVPSYVYRTRDEFAICPSCGRIYWEGTHHHNMEKMVEMFIKK